MDYLLCSHCLKRHSTHSNARACELEQDCFICGGLISKIGEICAQAVSHSKQYEFASYNIQTTFPKKILMREDELLDFEQMEESFALKNQANRIAGDALAKMVKQPFSANAELTFKLDLKNMQGKAVPANIFIFGHYLKKTREYCQHDWACHACRGRGCKVCNFHKQNWPAIEGAMRSIFAPAFGASDAHLHASGREDVDVMHLGTGRPFVLEIVNPQKRSADLALLGAKLASMHPIEALGLKFVSPFWIEAVCTSHFDKHYRAWVTADRELTDADWKKLAASLPILVRQQTPVRVLARRSDLIRPRRVYEIKPVSLLPKEWVLDIHAEAGTYIKELIHSDQGRTNPSFTSILGKQCQCKQLDVMGVDDFFLSTLMD